MKQTTTVITILTAMLLLRLAQTQTAQTLDSFRFQSRGPLFDLSPFRLVCTKSNELVELQAQGPDGTTAMLATATFA